MNELKKKYIEASSTYVEQEKLDGDVIGIVVSGSMKHSVIDKNSDIDIYVILDDRCEYRERGNLWIDGIEIEYFKNPPSQIKVYFDKERKSPHTAHMLAHGELVYGSSRLIDELITTAKNIIAEKPNELKNFEVELEKYFLDDLFKDFEDAIINDDSIGASLLRSKLIDRSINVFFKTRQLWRNKDKRISKQIEKVDERFKTKIIAAQSEKWNNDKALKELVREAEILLGGRRTKEWKLRSALDL